MRARWKADEYDIHLWQRNSGYKQHLMMETSKLLQITPKYTFISWVIDNRLSTCDMMTRLNQKSSVGLTLCQTLLETRDNMFLSCIYLVWYGLMSGILLGQFSLDWTASNTLLVDGNLQHHKSFIVQYIFQCTIHAMSCKRNQHQLSEWWSFFYTFEADENDT